MSNAISWNLQLSLRDGRLTDARALMDEMVASARQEAGTLGYEWFLAEDGSTCHTNERFSDSEAAVTHLRSFGANFAERFLQCFEPTGLAVYGSPSDEARAALDGLGAIYLGSWGGFIR
jgi:quinol monooxygenase YgiN